MFTPLKNLITYIQKNASGSTFFGGTTSNTELNENTIMENETVEISGSANPIPPPALTELATVNEKGHDQNENEVLDIASFTSSLADDPLMIKEDEGEKDVFLDFPPEGEHDIEFPASEVIVLGETDLNSSVISEPGIDPLAIDDCHVHPGLTSPNPLGVSNEVILLDEAEAEETAVKAAEEQEIRSDGSDSGLGLESSLLQTTATPSPLRSNLKRRLDDVDQEDQKLKKPKKSIYFDGVKVFYFQRIQGHGCVPSQGGCTLGMTAEHISFKTFSLAEHAAEIRRAHKLQLQEVNPRGSSSEDSDSDEELSEGSASDLDAESNGFLQPVSPKQRRALLKAAGVRKIDPNEKIECRNIRNSREVCGCVCRDFCDPETCACSQAGIKCQVDRAMFPCGCSRDACGNVIGRIEFNPARVRTHFIHTIMRLEMENRQQKRTDNLSGPVSHLVYNNVPAIANGTNAINSYSTIPGYGIEQNTTVAHVYHHHMHPQHSAYMNHMQPPHPANSVYAPLSNSMVMETSTAPLPLPLPLPLPQTHNRFVNATATEPDSMSNSSSLAMNGGNLHFADGSMYPPIQTSLLPPTPATAYGDILSPYAAASTPYHSAQVVDSNYTTNVYPGYHNAHHLHNHLQHHQSQPQYIGYPPPPTCSGEANDYNESQSSFISLSTPEASSSRLSAINDLLHNNRNTTAALVAVLPVSNELISSTAGASPVKDEDDPVCSSDENANQHKQNSAEKTTDVRVESGDEEKETVKRPETPSDEKENEEEESPSDAKVNEEEESPSDEKENEEEESPSDEKENEEEESPSDEKENEEEESPSDEKENEEKESPLTPIKTSKPTTEPTKTLQTPAKAEDEEQEEEKPPPPPPPPPIVPLEIKDVSDCNPAPSDLTPPIDPESKEERTTDIHAPIVESVSA